MAIQKHQVSRTLVVGILADHLAVGVTFELRTLPGAIEVGFDDHVCRRCVKGAVDSWLLASSEGRSGGVKGVFEQGICGG